LESWRRVLKHAEPFAAHIRFESRKARDVTAWSCKVRHKTAVDRIAGLGENERDRAGQPPELAQRWSIGDRDRIRCRVDQFSRCGLYALGLARAPAIVDPQVATVDPAALLQRSDKRRDERLALRSVCA
jgi:hypothetical protein